MPLYFCHQCKRTVEANEHLACRQCGGEFIEEVAEPSPRTFNANFGQHPFQFVINASDSGLAVQPDFFGSLMRSLFPGPSTTSAGSTASTTSPPNSSQQQQQQQSSRGGDSAPNPLGGSSAQPQDPFSGFINQLMANLASGVPSGGQVHIQINGQDGPILSNLQNYAFGDANFEQIITQLLNGYEQQAGLTEADLRRLPMTNVTQEHVDNGTQCTTCMDTFALAEEVAQLDCRHVFHKACIVPWLQRQKTCPICRHEVEPQRWPEDPARRIADVDELD